MKNIVVLLVHFFTTLAKRWGPGGVRAVVAENFLLKQQLLLLKRSAHRAPNLIALDRGVMGLCSLLMKPGRILQAAIGVKPATLLKFHRALKARQYRLLFASSRRGKRPQGPLASAHPGHRGDETPQSPLWLSPDR